MITSYQYELFLKNILEQIDCDWVIIGGSLLALLNASKRTTSDIDICALADLTNDRRLTLMKIAEESGLPVEAINPAADFFLQKIPNWKAALVLFKTGKNGNLYRPSIELYFKLKLNRASESDILDCISFLNWHNANAIAYNGEVLRALLKEYDSLKTIEIAKVLK